MAETVGNVTAVLDPVPGAPGEAVVGPAQDIRWAHITLPEPRQLTPILDEAGDFVEAQRTMRDHPLDLPRKTLRNALGEYTPTDYYKRTFPIRDVGVAPEDIPISPHAQEKMVFPALDMFDQLEAFRTGLSTERDGHMEYDGQIAYIPTGGEAQALQIIASKLVSGKELAGKFPQFGDTSPDHFYLVPDEYLAESDSGIDTIAESERGTKVPWHVPVEIELVERIQTLTAPLSEDEVTELAELEHGKAISSGVAKTLRHRIAPDLRMDRETLESLLREDGRISELLGTDSAVSADVATQPLPLAGGVVRVFTRGSGLRGVARTKTRWPSARGAVATDREREVGSSWSDGRETERMVLDEPWSPMASLRRRLGLAKGYAEAAGQWVRDNVEVGETADQSPSINIDAFTMIEAMIERGWDDPVRTEAVLLGHVPTGKEGGEDVSVRRELAADRAVLAQEMTYRVREIEVGFWETFGASLTGLDHGGTEREAYPDITRDPVREQEWRDWTFGMLFRDLDLGNGQSRSMLDLIDLSFAPGNTWTSVEKGTQYLEEVVFERLVALSVDRINAERISSGFAPFPREGQDEPSRGGLNQTRVMPAVIESPDDGTNPDDRDRPWRSRRR